MPDTGSPWNIPYVENADLVRDWPADSLLVANAVAAGLSAAGNAGIGSNVVQTVKTDVFTTTSTSYTVITGLTATITPTSATSKILVLANVKGASNQATSGGGLQYRLMRDSTAIYIGDASGSATQASGQLGTRLTGSEALLISDTAVMLDSPATTSAVIYSVQVRANAGTAFINKPESTSTDSATTRAASGITVIEVAA